jgi:cysteinyl-tRNA synthetase
MDWTEAKAREALDHIRGFIDVVSGVDAAEPDQIVIDALSDDLNTSEAITRLHALRKEERGAELLASAKLMGLLTFQPSVGSLGWGIQPKHQELAQRVASKWANLRASRKYEEADVLKNAAMNAGIELRVTKTTIGQGAIAHLLSNVDPIKLEGLL